MDFQRKLESLRGKPEHVKKHIAFWTSLGITLVIFVFWISSFGVGTTYKPTTFSDTIAKAGSPGRSLVAGVGAFFTDIKDIVFGAKKIDYAAVEVTPGSK